MRRTDPARLRVPPHRLSPALAEFMRAALGHALGIMDTRSRTPLGGIGCSCFSEEILRRREHVTAGVGLHGRWARRHHFYHHFDDARFNHGVTSPLWDLLMGTYRTAEVITIPPRLMMPWLGDPEVGVRLELAGTYALKGKKAA